MRYTVPTSACVYLLCVQALVPVQVRHAPGNLFLYAKCDAPQKRHSSNVCLHASAVCPCAGPGSRLTQICEWLGDGDYLVVFDECHKAKNCITKETSEYGCLFFAGTPVSGRGCIGARPSTCTQFPLQHIMVPCPSRLGMNWNVRACACAPEFG